MTARRGGWRTWGAILAAYLLVIQAALTGMTLGAHAAPQAGLFVDEICASSTAAPASAPGQSKHQGLPNCCVLGCAMFGGGAAPAPESAFVAPPRAMAAVVQLNHAFDAVAPTPERSPRSTRAPPLTA